MTTATAATSSTASTGITWKVLAGGNSLGNLRVKVTYQGVSKEYNVTSGMNLDPATEPVLWAVVNEMKANGTAGTQREGTVSITAASNVVRLPADTDYVAF
jgi:hypothetical protein